MQAGGTLSATNVANGIMEGLTLLGGNVTAPGVSSGEWGAFTIASTVTADGSTTSTISAELTIVDDPTFEVLTDSTLLISGSMHHRYAAGTSGIKKSGDGLLILGGVNSFTGNVQIDGGSLQLADNAQVKFVVTDSNSNQITGGGTASLNGDFTIDTAAVSGTTSHTWFLVDQNSLSSFSFGATFSVVGFDDTDNDGVWTLSDTKGTWSFSESTGELTLTLAPNDYANWASENNVSGTETDDDDGDGISNFSEYAFGLLPNNAASANPIAKSLDKATGKFSYTRRSAASTGLTYSVDYSTDLSSWLSDSNATPTIISTNGNVETVEVELSTLPGDPLPTKLFVRVRAN